MFAICHYSLRKGFYVKMCVNKDISEKNADNLSIVLSNTYFLWYRSTSGSENINDLVLSVRGIRAFLSSVLTLHCKTPISDL